MVPINQLFIIMMLIAWHGRHNKIPNESGKHEGNYVSESSLSLKK